MDNNEVLEVLRKATEELRKSREQINNLLESFDNLDRVRDAYHSRYPADGSRFGEKGVIYSAIIGNYDSINEPEVKSENIDYVLFSDRDIPDYSGVWDIRVLNNEMKLSNQRLARWVKMHPFDLFPDHDWSLWIDGSLRIKKDIWRYIITYSRKSGMLCFPHHIFKNIREEADAIVAYGKANEKELDEQIRIYEEDGYKSKGYIAETGVLLRDHHDKKLHEVMDSWWEELCSYEHNRDQMSFDYICWKYGYEYDLNDLLIYGNPYIEAVTMH